MVFVNRYLSLLFSIIIIAFAVFLIGSYPQNNFSYQEKIIPKKTKVCSDKGLYVTQWVAQTPRRFSQIKAQAKQAGLNTIVIDIKQKIENPITELAKQKKLSLTANVTPDAWLKNVVSELHKEDFIVSGRIVVFKDDHLAIARPDLAIKRADGKLYTDRKGGRWVDPYSSEVRIYNQLIAKIAAISGIDEVEYDYVRFPAEQGADKIISSFYDKRSKVDVINGFLKDTKQVLEKYNVSLAVDIFGVTAWQSTTDIVTLGQSIEAMAEYIDVICPMLYPSHFHRGYDGYANPGEEPYYFINTGVKKCNEILAGKKVKLVPWIQGFALGTKNFGPSYIAKQVKACNDEGIDSYLIWNAGNRYDQLPKPSSY